MTRANHTIDEQPDVVFRAGVAKLLNAKQQDLVFERLTGGVSSDIWRVDAPGLTVCAKRALQQLRVAQEWKAPVERNREEVRWLRYAAGVIPDQVPEVIAHDELQGIILLSWFDPEDWQNFKLVLLNADTCTEGLYHCTGEVGTLLANIHLSSRATPELAREFQHFEYFNDLRLDPFLVFTAQQHPETTRCMHNLIERMSQSRTALVHGDVSPKNVLMNAQGNAVLLDAECACWGNPAFDVAFMLTHLLLKVMHRHSTTPQVEPETNTSSNSCLALKFWQSYTNVYLGRSSTDTYLIDIEEDTSRLIPALLLARVDGKSPVEYLDVHEQSLVRKHSLALLFDQYANPVSIPALIDSWCEAY